LRHAGTVVHAVLQRIARSPGYRPNAASIRTSLAQLGVPAAELARTAQRAERAIARTLASERGRWILNDTHQGARSELAFTAAVDGRMVRGTIDRTFIDRDGTRRYRGQLERYGRIFGEQGSRVRLGLYFPLLDEWREWELNAV
jgi:hypothetical protein